LDYVIGDLLDHLETGARADPEAWKCFALELQRLRATMAPIFHLSNAILLACESEEPDLPARIRADLAGLRDRERRASAVLSRNAAVSLPGTRFLTVSSSGSVTSSLLELGSRRRISVVVMESLPGGEGKHAAELLSREGIEVELVRDSMAFDRARSCDAGVCGADSMSPAGVVNKVGTYVLASACAEAGIPCLLLASWGKCMPIHAPNHMVTERVEGAIKYREQVFETVPLSRFQTCINERGAVPAEDMIADLESMRLAEAWGERVQRGFPTSRPSQRRHSCARPS
jgi:translation initiation factor 2B subunit (eIF-2B alpha/beta/delta family)